MTIASVRVAIIAADDLERLSPVGYARHMTHPTAIDFRRGYADAPQGQVHFYDSGGAGVPLLLLHQSPASASDWFALAPLLVEGGLRVILMDTPGMGLSDAFAAAPTIMDYADIVPLLLDHLGIDRCHLLGHHTGAQIAIEAAVRHPDRGSSAALYGAPLMTVEERQKFWTKIVPRERDGALHKPVASGTNLTDHFHWVEGLFGPVAAQRLVLSALLAGPPGWHGHNAALIHDMGPAMTAATKPLLLITHASEMLHANTMAAASLRPDVELVELSLVEMNAMDDAPGELAEAVKRFIDDVERGGQTVNRLR